VGQYSVGKTTFIRYLLGRDYPGCRVGPEPTTEKFTFVTMSATNTDNVIPGNALAVQGDRPFGSLQKFGSAFLTKFEAAEVYVPPPPKPNANSAKNETARPPGEILRKISFVDTPGILSGDKQSKRNYDFTAVIDWFAGRCDRILLLFDCHKLDISNEFQHAIEALRGHDEKIRVVLNKASSVEPQQLMRVHGALYWALGKVIKTPEVVRVYVGSFWDEEREEDNKSAMFADLFKMEEKSLVEDLESLPTSAVIRKINEVVKRARAARIHALLMDHLRSQLPSFFGKEGKLAAMLENLRPEFKTISRTHGVPEGDFPTPENFRRSFEANCSLDLLLNMPPLNPTLLAEVNESLSSHLPRIVAMHNMGKKENLEREKSHDPQPNPFSNPTSNQAKLAAKGYRRPKYPDAFKGKIEAEKFNQYLDEFERLVGESGSLGEMAPGEPVALTGGAAKPALLSSGLPQSTLARVWGLADFNRDGRLDALEFALASHFMDLCLAEGAGAEGVGAEGGDPFEHVLPKELGDLRPR